MKTDFGIGWRSSESSPFDIRELPIQDFLVLRFLVAAMGASMRRQQSQIFMLSAALGAVLAGCGGPLGPSDEDLSGKAQEYLDGLAYKPMFSAAVRCSEAFEIGDVTIEDKQITGDTAQVKISVPITAKYELPPYGDAHTACYNLNRAFAAGQRITLKTTIPFQRWESGWQVVQRPPGSY